MKLPKHFGGQGFSGMLGQMQSAMARAQNIEQELALDKFEVEKGPVKAIFNGVGEIQTLKIDPSAVDPEDVEMLEDLLISVVRDGLSRATEMRNKKVAEITANMPDIPGLNL